MAFSRLSIETRSLRNCAFRVWLFTRKGAFIVYYRDKRVGVYVADIVVADRVIVELKAVAGLADAHTAQRLNYLRASQLPIGLLMNFGAPRPQWRRVIG